MSSKNEDHVCRSRNEDRIGRRQSVEQAAHSQQLWQPLGDGCWGHVVGREGAERVLDEAMIGCERNVLYSRNKVTYMGLYWTICTRQ